MAKLQFELPTSSKNQKNKALINLVPASFSIG